MRVKLVFPPGFPLEQPYPSLPALTSFLLQRGVEVSQADLNVASFDFLMRPSYLTRCARELEGVLGRCRGRRSLAQADYGHYWAICRALLAAPVVIPNIRKAVRFFRTLDGFSDLDSYILNRRIVDEALNLVSAPHYPVSVPQIGFSKYSSAQASGDILSAIADPVRNPYLSFLERYVGGQLKGEAPALVGISLAGLGQIIPGLALARLVREQMPATKIVVGGFITTLLAEKMRAIPPLFRLFDYLIRFEGETPLLRLCQHLEGECPIQVVPNLLYMDRGGVEETRLGPVEDVNDLPTPVYVGLPLDRYLSPVPLLSLEPARGCYWRKCTFCNQHAVHRGTFRVRAPEKTVLDMRRLQERYGAKFFCIVSEGLPAKQLSLLGEAILAHGLNVQWYAGARLEKGFTRRRLEVIRKAGCRRILFGLESGSQRVLDLMRKGIRLRDVPSILGACRRAGVDVHLYLMSGFPTECAGEAKQTADFVVEQLGLLDRDWFTFSVSVFRAAIGAPILEDLPRLGYRLVSKGPKYDLEFLFEHEVVDGRLPHGGRQEREQAAEELAANIRRHLPKPRFPHEMSHCLCYRVLPDARPSALAAGQDGAPMDMDALSRDGYRFRLSPWVTLRSVQVPHDASGLTDAGSARLVRQHVAYELRSDKCYGLSRSAVAFLERFRRPRSLDAVLGEWRRRSADEKSLREGLLGLVSRGLVEISAPKDRDAEPK